MVTLTEAAVTTLEQVIARSGGVAKGLRLAVADGGCAGHKYQMGPTGSSRSTRLAATTTPC